MDIKDLCKIVELFENGNPKECEWPWVIGKKYFIRTVTMHLTGELVGISERELLLKDAAWIADSGRFNEAIRDIEKCNEVEPFDKPVIVGRGSIIDATEISAVILKVK